MSSRGYTIKDAKKIMDDVVDVFIEVLSENENITLRGFGKFVIKHIRVTGSLPKWVNTTGSPTGRIDEYPVVRFTPALNLRIAVSTQTAFKRDTRVGSHRSEYSYQKRTSKKKEDESDGGADS